MQQPAEGVPHGASEEARQQLAAAVDAGDEELAQAIRASMESARLRAAFVEDISWEDGAKIAPSCRFSKAWVVKNTGTLDSFVLGRPISMNTS